MRMNQAAATFVGYIRPHWGRLHTVARQYVANDNETSDLVQETLLRAWRHFSSAEQAAFPAAWLFVIMRNVALDWQASARRRLKLTLLPVSQLTEVAGFEDDDTFASLPALSEEAFREFLDERIAAAVDALDGPYREVLILSVAGGLHYREIAEVLDCPIGTVMSRMARARRALRERLADHVKPSRASKEARS